MAQTYTLPQRRGVPAWAALALIALCLAGATYYCWKLVFGSKGTAVIAQLDLPNSRPPRDYTVSTRQRGPQFRPDVVEGVSKSSSSWSQAIYARKGNTALIGKPNGGSGVYAATLTFLDSDNWTNFRQRMTERQARALLVTRSQAEYVGLTGAQRTQLQALFSGDVDLSEQERSQASALFVAWAIADKAKDAAGKQKAAEALLAAVTSADTKYRSQAKAQVAHRVDEIPKLLSAEQLRKAAEWRDRPPQDTSRRQGPASRPATRPTGGPGLPATRPG